MREPDWDGATPENPGLAPEAEALLRSEIGDLERAISRQRKRRSRHFLWAYIGLTPAAAIPFVSFAARGSGGLIGILVMLVFLTESWRAVRATRELRRMEARLGELRDRLAAGPGPDGRGPPIDPTTT